MFMAQKEKTWNAMMGFEEVRFKLILKGQKLLVSRSTNNYSCRWTCNQLRPITETIPKSLVEVAGVPFIVGQLNYLKKQNIEKVIMCVGHLER